MMRYQRVSPDCLPLSNGKKPNLRPSPSRASPKEDNNNNNHHNASSSSNGGENGKATPTTGACTSSPTSLHGGVTKGFRFRSPSRTRQQDGDNGHSPSASPSLGGANAGGGGGDVLLQWGQRKRSRVSRAEIRSVTDDSSSSSGQGRLSSANKVHRRSLNPSMPPPPPPPPLLCSVTRGTNLRNGLVTSKESSGFASTRNLEDRSAVTNGSPSRSIAGNTRTLSRSAAAAGKRSPPSPDKKVNNGKDLKQQNGFITGQADHHHRANRSESTAQIQSEQETTMEKPHVEVIEWPRIYIALSRKEKEEDFLAMKGTKLPHRPRKRAKNVDKALQYCFPGMWLSDLNKSRYEVREKKCVKKQKRRGLKAMESMDTDSE